MSRRSRHHAIGILSSAFCLLLGAPGAASDEIAQLDDFVGCWISSEPSGTMVVFDAFKEDGYTLAEENVMLSIQPVEGGRAFRNLTKGTLDVWSETRKYYLPTIYYDAAYDPIQGTLVSDSTFYIRDDELVFVHHRTTDESSDRALRFLKRVDCDAIGPKRKEIHGRYRNLSDDADKSDSGLNN